MIEFATDFVSSVFRDYFGLPFEIVDSSNLRLENCVFLTSGSSRLMLRLAKVDSASSTSKNGFRIKLFGGQFDVHYRAFEDNVRAISQEDIIEAVGFAESLSAFVRLIDCESQVNQLGFELPDIGEIENEECARLIADRIKCPFMRIPIYCGRMLDGAVIKSSEDERGRSRYIQFSPFRPLNREQVVLALQGLVTLSPEWKSSLKSNSEVFIDRKPGKGLLLSRRF